MAHWQEIRDAIAEAIAEAAGIDAVIWANQDTNQPADPYVEMAISSLDGVGLDYIRTRVRAAGEYPEEGEEIELSNVGVRELGLELAAFTDDEMAALDLMETLKASLIFDGPTSKLAAVGVSVFDLGPVGWVPEIRAAEFRGRAICSLRCYVPAEAVKQYTTWIERVEGTATVEGGADGNPIERNFTAP